MRTFVVFLLLAFAGVPSASAQLESVYQELIFPELPLLQQPLGIRSDGTEWLYIPEYDGRIRVMRDEPDVDTAYVFLDISDKVVSGQPRGEFYSIALHPDFQENGYVFVCYQASEPLRTVIARYTRSADDPLRADPDSEVVLFEIPQPGYTHSGDDLAFGLDGYLYIPLGDGGTYLDEAGNAQDRTTLLGSVLRIDVDNPSGGRNYSIPADNPFVGNTEGWREEIYAYGFRNPWRLTVDRVTGDIWLGDVGEVSYEEINRIVSGGNYGWPVMEAFTCFPETEPQTCDQSAYVLPVHAYSHASQGDVGSVNGGYVYRGEDIPELYGYYVFGDFSSKQIWALDPADPAESIRLVDGLNEAGFAGFVSFGENADGEIYFAEFFGGKVRRLSARDPNAAEPELEETVVLQVAPNPSRGESSLYVQAPFRGPVEVTVFDLLGREIALLYDGPMPASGQLNVDLGEAGLPTGVYVCRVSTADGHYTVKATRLD